MLKRILQLLSRMDTAIILLGLLALASSAGTLISQQLAGDVYGSTFGLFWARVFQILGIFDVYRTPWFWLILIILLVSVSVCMTRNGPTMLKLLMKPPKKSVTWLQRKAVKLSDAPSTRGFWLAAEYKSGDATVKLYQRGILHRAGYFVAHLSVITIAVAGLLSASGWRAQLNILPQTQNDTAYIVKNGERYTQQLPFKIRLDAFKIEHLPDGRDAEFTSEISIVDAVGNVKKSRELQVNRPLSNGAYKVFQSSYGDGGSALTFDLVSVDGEVLREDLQAQVGQPLKTDDGGYQIQFTNYVPETPTPVYRSEDQQQPDMVTLGAAVDYILTQPNSAPLQLRAYQKNTGLIGLGDGEGNFTPVPVTWLENMLFKPQVLVRLSQIKPQLYSSLLVAYDPGAWLFWPSCLALVFGLLALQYGRFEQMWQVTSRQGTVAWYARYHHDSNVRLAGA